MGAFVSAEERAAIAAFDKPITRCPEGRAIGAESLATAFQTFGDWLEAAGVDAPPQRSSLKQNGFNLFDRTPPNHKAERNARIIELHAKGMKLSDIGALFEISGATVCGVVDRERRRGA